MAQVPECVVCLQAYDDFLHVPRVLACGHSFCELCLMQLQSAWQPSSSVANSNDDLRGAARGAMIRCPECSHRTRLPVGGQQSLPKNVELLRLLPSLIREADSTTRDEGAGEANEKKTSAGLNEPLRGNGNKNDRAATVPGRRDGGVGTGNQNSSSDSRRPKVGTKGKNRTDSNQGSSIVVDRSYLLPFHLYSENSNDDKDVRSLILPEKAIELRGDVDSSSRCRLVDSSTLCGKIVLERDRLSSSVPVRLWQLFEVSCAPHSQQDDETTTTSYEDSVLKAWDGCHYEVKTELLILFRVSVLSRGVCNVLGVWMNPQRNALFLVTQAPAPDEIVSPWEMIKKSFRQNEKPSLDVECRTDDQRSTSDVDEPGSLSSAASEVTRPAELSEAALSALQQKVSSSAVVEQMRLSRVGIELCGTLCEVQSHGLIFGLLSPNCFVLDLFGSLLIDLNAALHERSSLLDGTTRLSSCSSQCAPEGGGCKNVNNASQEDFDGPSDYTNCCWRYMSPEALSLLVPSTANQTTQGDDASSSSSFSSDRLQHRLTCQADVWSLGCLLLELVSGKAPFQGLTFPQVLQKVLVEREKPGNFRSFLFDSCTDHGGALSTNELAILLPKCFEYDPDDRPRLGVLHRCLMELGWWSSVAATPTGSSPPEEQRLQSEAAGGSADQKYWVLSLAGFARDGCPESGRGREADVEESQRHLSLFLRDNGVAAAAAAAADNGRELQPCGLEHKASLSGHRDYVTALAICGDYMLSASFDKTIRVWSLEEHKLHCSLQGHSHMVAALAVDQNTFQCFSGDTGGKICAWKIGENAADDPLIATWQEHDDWRYTGVASLAVSADGILYSGSGDRTVKAWSLQNFSSLGVMAGHKLLVSALLVDRELLYSGSWDGTIHVWWRSDQSLVAVLGGGSAADPSLGGVRVLYMSDNFLFTGRDGGAIQVWRDEECLTTVKAHDMVVSALYVEGDFLYSGSWDQQIKAWKVDKFLSDPSPTLVRQCGFALSSLVSDGDMLYAGLADRAIKAYSLLGDTWASLVQML